MEAKEKAAVGRGVVREVEGMLATEVTVAVTGEEEREGEVLAVIEAPS